MFCIKCGRELEDEANFCPVCGTRRAEAPDKISKDEKKRPVRKVKGRRLAAIVLVLIALVLATVLIIGGQSKGKAGSKPVVNAEPTTSVSTPAKSDKPGSGLTTKDELKDKYDVKSTPKPTPKPTAKPKSSKSGSGLVTKDDLFKKYPGKSDSAAQTEQVSGATEN